MRWLILIPLLALALLLVIFGVQNPQLVTVRLLSFEAQNLSLSIVIVLSAIGGALVMGLLSLWGGIRRGLRGRRSAKERASLEARNRELESELATLRNPTAAPVRAAEPAAKK